MSIFESTKVIAIEEHYIDPNITKLQEENTKNTRIRNPKMVARMEDFGGERIEEMDAAGIDVQILSIAPPGVHNLPKDVAVDAAKLTNDYLAKKMSENPDKWIKTLCIFLNLNLGLIGNTKDSSNWLHL